MNIKINLIIITAIISFSTLYAAELQVTFKNDSDQILAEFTALSAHSRGGRNAKWLYRKDYFKPGHVETTTLKNINTDPKYLLKFIASNPFQLRSVNSLTLELDELGEALKEKHIIIAYSPAYTLKKIKNEVERKQKVALEGAEVPSEEIESKEPIERAVVPGIPGGVQSREELQLELKKAHARINALVDENRLLRAENTALRIH